MAKKKKNVEGANEGENGAVPINAKGQKMTRGPMTCIRCGEKGHRQASSKCPLNGLQKRESGINLGGILQKLSQENFAHHTGQLVKKYYGIVQEGSLEAALRSC